MAFPARRSIRCLMSIARPHLASRVVATIPTATRPYSSERRPGQGDFTENIPDPSHQDVGPNKRHAVDKPAMDVQAEASHKAHQERATGETASQATSRRDERDSQAKGKEQHPKAPGPILGMNDERGGKGV